MSEVNAPPTGNPGSATVWGHPFGRHAAIRLFHLICVNVNELTWTVPFIVSENSFCFGGSNGTASSSRVDGDLFDLFCCFLVLLFFTIS